eukprot:XP_001696781.1 predicted protein [Chlamydomonas reinhardtii]
MFINRYSGTVFTSLAAPRSLRPLLRMGRLPLRLTKGCLLAVLFLGTLAWTGRAQDDPEAGISPILPGFEADVAALNRFPFCQCEDYRCSSSPYRLDSIDSPTGRTDELCYRINRVGCSQANPCCKMLLTSLGKVEFSVEKSCSTQYLGSWVNGVKRNSYFDTDFATGKIRVTPLGMTADSAANTTICLRFQPGATCGSYPALCGNTAGMCTYATTSRFRLDYANSTVAPSTITYNFNLYVIRPQDCWAPGYRGGSCCNQTLVNIELNLAEGIQLADLGNATLTTSTGKVLRVSKQRDFWGVKLYPNDDSRGRDYTPSLFVTNFTDGKPWKLSVEVKTDAFPTPSPSQWPCGPSKYLKDDPNVCDIMLNGFQTVIGQPTTVLNATGYDVPNCCPEGIIRYKKEDNCCIDNLAENPYRLGFNATNNSTQDDTILTFKLSYAGVSSGPFGGVFDGSRTNCSVSEVDQLELFIAPETLNSVYKVTVDGQEADFTRDSNKWQSWIRAVNLHKVSKTPSLVSVFFAKDVTPDQVCTSKVATNPLCEYVLRGSYDASAQEFMCCPAGATAVAAASCPAWDVLAKVQDTNVKTKTKLDHGQLRDGCVVTLCMCCDQRPPCGGLELAEV